MASRVVGERRWRVLALVCLCQFLVVMESTIVIVALPSIQRDLGFSATGLAWVVNAYALMFGGFLLLGGRAADLFGRKRVLLSGVALFAGASLFAGLARAPVELVACRALQGLGAAMISPSALSTVMVTFPDGRERTRAFMIAGSSASLAAASGQLFGGLLTDLVSWSWVFFVNVPLGVAAIALASRLVPGERGPGAGGGFDVAGAAVGTGGLLALVWAIVSVQDRGWASPATLGCGVLAVALLAGFVAIEATRARPLVRLGIFRVRSLAVASAAMLLAGTGVFAMFYFATLYVQDVLGYSPLRSGFAFLPVSTCIVAGSISAQRLIGMLGVRRVLVGGLSTAAVGLVLMTRTALPGDYATQVLPALVVLSLGLGHVFAPLALLATSRIASREAGLASGLYNTSQQLGGVLGLALLSTLAAARTRALLAAGGVEHGPLGRTHALLAGYHLAFLAGAGFAATAAILVAAGIRRGEDVGLDEPTLDRAVTKV